MNLTETSVRSRTPHAQRFTLAIIGATLFGAAPATAQGAESEITALNNDWIAAEIHHDKGTLERVLDSRFLATLETGKTIDKSAYINWIMSSPVDPFEVVNRIVTIHGDAALVVGIIKGEPLKVTWVAVRKAGVWTAISITFSKIAAPQ
jgi:hypothetical protein